MLFFTASFFCFFGSLGNLAPFVVEAFKKILSQSKIEPYKRASEHLRFLTECLSSGVLPSEEEFKRIESFPVPYSIYIPEMLRFLRGEGAPLIPTLDRMQEVLNSEVQWMLNVRTKTAQAYGQSYLSLGIIPLFAIVIHSLLPEVRESGGAFLILTLFCFGMASLAFVWMVRLSEQAQYLDLKECDRDLILSAQLVPERILALMSTGLPPDLAWKNALIQLAEKQSHLAHYWTTALWETQTKSIKKDSLYTLIETLGVEIKRAIQVSLIEGTPSMDRIEALQKGFQQDFHAKVDTELNLLPTRCLKPLYLFVLPSMMLLLLGTMYLVIEKSMEQW